MKKKFYVTAIILVLTLTICLCVGCNLFDKDNTPQKYFVEIGQVEDSRVASIVANNTLASCVRISANFPSINKSSKSSGFFVTSDGYVITNRHCVVRFTNGDDLPSGNEEPIRAEYVVMDAQGNSYGAKLVSYSKTVDVALLKVVPNVLDTLIGATMNFKPLTFDTESEPYYGDRLYTIGNPENMGFILSEFMVASPGIKLSSNAEHYSIILDGNVNHGNSGGALIDVNSHVVGLIYARVKSPSNTTTVNPDEDAGTYGLGCAIPAKVVTEFLDECEIEYSKYTPTTSEDTPEA